MKDKLIMKYVSPSFSQQLLDKWNMLTQETSRPPTTSQNLMNT